MTTNQTTANPTSAAPSPGAAGAGSSAEEPAHLWDAEEYDSGSRGQFQTALEALMEAGAQLLVGGRLADVGCGSGRLAEAMAIRDFSVVATDVSPSMVEATQRRCAGRQVSAVVQDAGRLTLEPAAFDVVHSSWMLHWLPDPAATLAVMARAVRPGGKLVLQWSCAQPREDGFALRDVLQSVFDRPAWRDRLSAAPLAMFQHPVAEVRAALEAAGLEVALVEEDLDVPGGETPEEMRRSLRAAAFAAQAAVLGDDVDQLIDESLAALADAAALRVANARIIASRPRSQPGAVARAEVPGRGDRGEPRGDTSIRRFPLSVGFLEVLANQQLSNNFQRLELALNGAKPLPVEEPAETLTLIWPADDHELVLPESGRWRFPHGTPPQHTVNYTVRRHDPAAGRLTIDAYVHHGAGVGGSWASSAVPGDRVGFGGTRVHWVTEPDAPWVLLIGDETALPSIAAIAESLPGTSLADSPVIAVIELGDQADRAALDISNEAMAAIDDLHWIVRGSGPDLVAAVAAIDLPAADGGSAPETGAAGGTVWGGCELSTIRRLREHLVGDRGLDRSQLRLQAYWIDSTAG